VGAALVVPLLTLSWIAHNVGIHRRKGPRRAVTPANTAYSKDFAGRMIVADWEALGSCPRIAILADGEIKRYIAIRETTGVAR